MCLAEYKVQGTEQESDVAPVPEKLTVQSVRETQRQTISVQYTVSDKMDVCLFGPGELAQNNFAESTLLATDRVMDG